VARNTIRYKDSYRFLLRQSYEDVPLDYTNLHHSEEYKKAFKEYIIPFLTVRDVRTLQERKENMNKRHEVTKYIPNIYHVYRTDMYGVKLTFTDVNGELKRFRSEAKFPDIVGAIMAHDAAVSTIKKYNRPENEYLQYLYKEDGTITTVKPSEFIDKADTNFIKSVYDVFPIAIIQQVLDYKGKTFKIDNLLRKLPKYNKKNILKDHIVFIRSMD
jgi:hypothetical protein